MKAQELRIGNLVTLNEEQRQELWNNQIHAQNDFFEVKTIYSDNDISLELDDEIVDISENDVDGILLDEKWLIKAGLQKNNGYPYKFLNGFIKIRNGIYFYKYYNLDIELKYVHQLQNLYFTLTGSELSFETQS